ncbi:MAG: hypothetical protein HC807_01580 [Gammaproteobacteria bacterium]|nr:hypothetical protein [Gammaproteobacteria bacterium]
MAFFSSQHITEFAKRLAESLVKRYPPALDVNPEKKVSEARLSKVLEDTLAQAVEFQKEHRLGLFGKAKLGNEFKWQLKEHGYTEQFIDLATEGLMVYVSRGSAAASQTKVRTSGRTLPGERGASRRAPRRRQAMNPGT